MQRRMDRVEAEPKHCDVTQSINCRSVIILIIILIIIRDRALLFSSLNVALVLIEFLGDL